MIEQYKKLKIKSLSDWIVRNRTLLTISYLRLSETDVKWKTSKNFFTDSK